MILTNTWTVDWPLSPLYVRVCVMYNCSLLAFMLSRLSPIPYYFQYSYEAAVGTIADELEGITVALADFVATEVAQLYESFDTIKARVPHVSFLSSSLLYVCVFVLLL